ncbi:MAG: alpha/beta hydrolase [Phycisphaerales bacterium]
MKSTFVRSKLLAVGAVLVAVALAVSSCGKKPAKTSPGDNMEGGSGIKHVEPEVVGSAPNEPQTSEQPDYVSVVRSELPSDVTDDPNTPEDERLEHLPPNDERRIEAGFEEYKEFRKEAEVPDDPETLPVSLGGLTADAEFYGGNGDVPDDPNAPVITKTDKGRRVRVWYGTNRAFVDPKDPSKGFSNDRELGPTALHVGSVICDVPDSRPVGTTGSGWVTRLIKGEDDRIKISQIFVDDEDLMFRQIARRLELAPENQRAIVIYVHGYKNSFQSAALRAAQLAVDLNVPGLTAFYSWPSRDEISEYNADEAAVETAEKHLKHFLVRMAKDTNASKVHIIAHSMGNRVLARVMQRIMSSEDTKDIKFGQIILAAPDIDTEVFYELAAAYPKLSDRTTLYVSQKDKALEASAWSHSFHRAGYCPPVAVLPPIDTIEVTNIDVSVLGHGYVAEAENVLFDIAMMIRQDTPPDKRPRLNASKTAEGKGFWVLQK